MLLTGMLSVLPSKSLEWLAKARITHSCLGTPTSVINEENVQHYSLQSDVIETLSHLWSLHL